MTERKIGKLQAEAAAWVADMDQFSADLRAAFAAGLGDASNGTARARDQPPGR